MIIERYCPDPKELWYDYMISKLTAVDFSTYLEMKLLTRIEQTTNTSLCDTLENYCFIRSFKTILTTEENT